MTKYNKKSEDAPYDAGRSTPDYPWVRGEADINGGSHFTYADPDKFEESYVEKFFHNAGFEITENAPDGKNGLTNKLSHEIRDYSSGGHSSHSDGQRDVATLDSSIRTNAGLDHGTSAGNDTYQGSGGKMVASHQQGSFTDSVNGDTYMASDGAEIKDFVGDINHNIEGDHITSITGNKHTMLSQGEYGVHIQGGNMDIQVDSGQYRVKSGMTLTIESGVTIVLKVGGDTITLTGSGINISSAGVITTLGTQTKVQGGGRTAPPTTFTL